ncbi:hypothetical protein C5167_019382 [Papaver somniferum]|uniref:Uncharacterized protein n=1 Tax=Papaver somniferum TaxID=3469 RepID=A0A4Y7IT25_PAPSO|nr:hypothetical protein C5167_019382 [Papaver somniferum]
MPNLSPPCCFCGTADETISHLLLHYTYSKDVRFGLGCRGSDEKQQIADTKIFTCRVASQKEGSFSCVLASMKWAQQQNGGTCTIQLRNKKLVKELKKKWRNHQSRCNNEMVDEYVDYISYLRLFECECEGAKGSFGTHALDPAEGECLVVKEAV